MRVPLVVAAAAVSALVAVGSSSLAGTASTSHVVHFHTPSGNIACNAWNGQLRHGNGVPSGESIECWVVSTAGGPYGFPYAWHLQSRGGVTKSRPSDGPTPGGALPYGTTWQRRDLRCTSKSTGLKCWSTSSGHGFFLSRDSQRRF